VGYFSRKQKSNAAVKKKCDFLAIHKGKETRRTLLVERERAKSHWSGKGKSLALFTQNSITAGYIVLEICPRSKGAKNHFVIFLVLSLFCPYALISVFLLILVGPFCFAFLIWLALSSSS